MFEINEDKTINITRGDIGAFTVDVLNEAGEKYLFQKGDVVRIKVTEKKACENVMFQKDFVVEEETEQVEILLTEEETKIGEVISKPTDYWYEIELNPLTNPQTIIGYDEDGAKIFKLFPEGKDIEPVEPTPEDIPVVDEELDITSERPVQNQAITRAMLNLQEEIERVEDTKNITSEDLEPLAVGIEENKGNIAKNTGNIEDLLAHAKNTSNPHNVTANQVSIDNSASGLSANNVQGAIDELKGTVGYSKKNLLETTYSSQTLSDVAITVNSDKSATFKGTSSSLIVMMINTEFKLSKGTYILSGCPKGGSSTTYKLDITDSNGSPIYTDYGNGVEFSVDSGTYKARIVVYSNVTINTTFYPMIRYASIEDDTFEPYAEDVGTRIDSIKTQIGDARCINLKQTLTDISGEPWKEIKAQYSSFPYNRVIFGKIIMGSQSCYIGMKVSDTYGSFMILQYNCLFHVYLQAGKWYFKIVTNQGTEF